MDDVISRQAAINEVKRLHDVARENWKETRISANTMIDALKALPSAQPEPCGDVVSRNAIVQKLNEMDRYVSTELRLCDTDKKFPQNEVFIVDDVYEEIVEQLPSAQPETAKFIRWMECKKTAEYISYTPHCKCSKCGTEFLITTIKYCYMCGAKMEENNEAD